MSNHQYTAQTKPEIIDKYVSRMQKIKRYAQHSNINESDFDNFVIKKYFNNCNKMQQRSIPSTKRFLNKRKLLIITFTITIALAIGFYRNIVSSLFMKNIQSFIYPGMSFWRTLTIPIIKTFPALTELYDETCLMSNPLFQIKDLDCRPCQRVLNILDLTNIQPQTSSENVPYIFKVREGDSFLSFFCMFILM